MGISKEKKLQLILDFVNDNDISAYKIAKETKISEAGIGKILNKSSKNPQERTIDAIYSFLFKEKKEGSLIETINSFKPEAIWVNYEGFKLVPLVNKRAQAGFLSGWGDDEYIEDLPKVPWEVDKEYKGNYMTFEVSGDSMESDDNPRESLYEGDLLLCREVQKQHWKSKLHIHKWDFIIVHREEGILAKRIKEHKTGNGTLTLHSLNPYYNDFDVEMDDLIAIFNIIDVKRSRRR